MRELDATVFFITEESARDKWPHRPLCTIISDPTDRSIQFADFIKRFSEDKGDLTLGELFAHQEAVIFWESAFGRPITITGPTTSLTCVWDDGCVIFTIILNYITGELVLVANGTVKAFDTTKSASIDFDLVMSGGRSIVFPKRSGAVISECHNRVVTYLQKSPQYRENLVASNIMNLQKGKLHYDAPGGPARPLYLSDFQPDDIPVGFILANGEKLPEWIGWLSFAMAAKTLEQEKALRMFEVFTDRPHMRDGVLMSTSPHYSLFHQCSEGGVFSINLDLLRNFSQPSQFRSMIVLVPVWNFPVVNSLRGLNYREIML